ncbi:helix-turn-helix domain-containing protein [Serratia fonticola]|uniref:helix-turn-helix domain-containing protein n=1 Tax=Serratia fonticola TaxID=47917 RepID=UPI001AE70DD8|nr:helix-turn-helix transcriptional regulator [Serratia fonticola]MBP1000144.1 helix-turn-helix transcriptional regulator [Serratia fonticola]MBP1005108.1 helix-turn-helix transcriptional regulator [Serratia fonticola]MBP1014794.1 helix-turn-helix transcriptional regulator [Serratia fonticola]MBP1036317.1 helix-turn-helix transcriptional regulator [Serratia fonticola]
MPGKINIITDNYYFFVGLKAYLHAEGRVINQMALNELKNTSASSFGKEDVLVFYMLNSISEMSFLIAVAKFPGKIIFLPTAMKIKFNLSVERHIALAEDADVDAVFNELVNIVGGELPVATFLHDSLTRREKAVLLSMIDGMNMQAIGLSLRISTKTVYTHRRNALHKLGVRNLFQACPIKTSVLNAAIFSG